MGSTPKSLASVNDTKHLRKYLAEVRKKFASGVTTEHSFRSCLETLIGDLREGLAAVNEPTRVACGAPDLIIYQKRLPIGYIETKDIDIDLTKVIDDEQLTRYRASLRNLILTNYLEFIWFVDGIEVFRASLGSCKRGKISLKEGESEKQVDELLVGFTSKDPTPIHDPQVLAKRLASCTQNIKNLILKTLEIEEDSGWLHKWFKAFKDVLISQLDDKEFADMFAQTLTYGLFAARIHVQGKDLSTFSRLTSASILPKTNPFLRKLFNQFAGAEMPETLDWAVDEVVEVLRNTSADSIFQFFLSNKGESDPVVHFYETFLSEYDPALREARGVYYTPKPIVDFIVRATDDLLISEFNRKGGLADESTLILDPATGTASFLNQALEVIHKKFKTKKGAWSAYVEEHVLNRIFGFEILMAPYSIAHLKIGHLLQKTGYEFKSDQRLGIFLTNTLEEAAKKCEELFLSFISDEANAASAIKKDHPIMVVLGNPPYSLSSQNRGDWIQTLIEDYKTGLNEKKLNLDDDFIKFIRFAQWRVDQTGFGIIAYITNNTFLDGITHRRMRESLLESFSDIYVLNLHGNSMRREVCPDGTPDKNVFDIRPGVAITFFVKKDGHKQKVGQHATVHYSDLYGSRESKYAFLSKETIKSVPWKTIKAAGPAYFFIPKDKAGANVYSKFISVKDIFPLHSSGIQTKRDGVAIQFSQEDIRRVVKDFAMRDELELREKYKLPKDNDGWKLEWAIDDAKKLEKKKFKPVRVQYRPFDTRWTIIDPEANSIVARPRYEVMQHFIKRQNNIGLVLTRQLSLSRFRHAWVTRDAIDGNTISMQTREYNYVFPLYLASDNTALLTDGQRLMNVSPMFIEELAKTSGLRFTTGIRGDLKKTMGPEDLFYYVYALLNSNSYRDEFNEDLKTDFPRIPIPSNKPYLSKLVRLGEDLAKIHLLEAFESEDSKFEFPNDGSNVVMGIKVDSKKSRVYINDAQYFGGITPELIAMEVGGFKPLEKYLKERKGRKLQFSEIEMFLKMATSLSLTPGVVEEIDSVMGEAGGWAEESAIVLAHAA